MMDILQDNWNELLSLPEQRIKLSNALSASYTPCYISKELLAGTFIGDTKTIVCYLGKDHCCNCEEYQRSYYSDRLPCTHMYRLAYEFNIIDNNGTTITNQGVSTDIDITHTFSKIISTIEKYFSSNDQVEFINNISQNKYRYIYPECFEINRPFCANINNVKNYINSGLLEICYDSNLGLIFNHGFNDIVTEHLDLYNYKWPNNLEKTKKGTIKVKSKRDWCLAHPNEVIKSAYPNNDCNYVMVKPSIDLFLVWPYILQYLERKFYDEKTKDKFNRFETIHPVGAIVTNYRLGIYEFPNDMVTKELTKNGHNRCISKKAGIGEGKLYREKSNQNNLTFTIIMPSDNDYEEMSLLLESLYNSYTTFIETNDTTSFIYLIDTLKKLDKFIDYAADKSVALLALVRTFINNHIKDENKLKQELLNASLHMKNGDIIKGYEHISNIIINDKQIKTVIL